MSVGISGSHRVGKSTLARMYSERAGMPFLETKTSGVFAKLDLDPKVDYDFKTRLAVQREILKSANEIYLSANYPFITDRTPLDMLAYTLADVTRENVNGELVDDLMLYVNECFDVLNRHFGMILVIPPGIELKEEEGKAPANKAYVEHIHTLILGLALNDRVQCSHFRLPRSMTNLEARIDALDGIIYKMAERQQQQIGEQQVH